MAGNGKRKARSRAIPSGKVHSQINRTTAVIGAVAAWYFGYAELGLYGAASLVITDALFSPDLDGAQSNAKSRWRKVGLAWVFAIYERYPHRSIWTHAPGIANVVMIGYLLLLAVAVLTARDFFLNLKRVLLAIYGIVMAYPLQSGAVFGGYVLMTAMHTIADWWVKEGEKMDDSKKNKKPTARPARREMRKAA